jgi:hypothetical protein
MPTPPEPPPAVPAAAAAAALPAAAGAELGAATPPPPGGGTTASASASASGGAPSSSGADRSGADGAGTLPAHLMAGASCPAPDAGPSKKYKPPVRGGSGRGRAGLSGGHAARPKPRHDTPPTRGVPRPTDPRRARRGRSRTRRRRCGRRHHMAM